MIFLRVIGEEGFFETAAISFPGGQSPDGCLDLTT